MATISLALNGIRRPCTEVGSSGDLLRSEFNPFTLRVPIKSNICYFYTFENNLIIKGMFAKYFNESCFVASDKHFFFKYFPKNAFVKEIFPKSSGLFWPL